MKHNFRKAFIVTRVSEYSSKEELLNVLTHAIGFIFSIIGTIALCLQANSFGSNTQHLISYIVYGSTLITFYLASTLYHSFSNTNLYYILKKIDHLSIYFLIAGTYSPLILIGIKSSMCFITLCIIWSLAFINCFLKSSKYKFCQNIGFVSYLIMGWFVLIVKEELSTNLSSISYTLLFIGGLIYTFGVIFYLWNKLPFNHSIWHVFVLGGSTSHYFSIYNLLIKTQDY